MRGYSVKMDGSADTIEVLLPNIEQSLVEGDRVAVRYVDGVPFCTRALPPPAEDDRLDALVPSALPSADQAVTALLWLCYFGLASATAIVMGPATHNMGVAAQFVTVAATLPAPGS
jgi:hypothetical protein